MVRGYSFESFDASECNPPPDAPDSCPVFDQLLGSRIAVANLELRFPLFGALGIGSGYYGALPVDFLAFAVAEVDLARPFDRPGKGWVWEFQPQPGF